MNWKRLPSLSILLTLLAAAGITYIISVDHKPEVIFAGKTTYYIPGKNNLCDWVAYVESDVTREAANFSRVFIGIPKVEVRGSVVATLEAHDDKAILSYNLTAEKKSMPVVMVGNLSGKSFPVENIRFRWLKSTLLTIPFYGSQKSCLKSMSVRK